MTHKKTAVIGDPIDHSLSPKIHNYWLKKNRGGISEFWLNNKKNELVWQGIGKGYIYSDLPEKKGEKISAMVSKILLQFPPSKN